MKGFNIFWCSPSFEGWLIEGLIEANERERLAHDLEFDTQWEIDNGLHDEETEIDYVPIELLAEIGQ